MDLNVSFFSFLVFVVHKYEYRNRNGEMLKGVWRSLAPQSRAEQSGADRDRQSTAGLHHVWMEQFVSPAM